MMKYIKNLLITAFLGLSATVLAAVNINTANVEELQQLKGIGAKKAADIVAYREANGDFKTVDELTKVKGIGKATLNKLRDDITVVDKTDDSHSDTSTASKNHDTKKSDTPASDEKAGKSDDSKTTAKTDKADDTVKTAK